jgi:hypothetical protein
MTAQAEALRAEALMLETLVGTERSVSWSPGK